MPVGIAQALNATNNTITYHNLESGKQLELQGRTGLQYDKNKLPSSNSTDDTLPWYDAGRDDKCVRIGALDHILCLCERDSRFYIYDTNGHSLSFGHLKNAAKYVLRFDPILRPNGQYGLSVTVHVYADALKSSNGELDASTLLNYEPNASMILIPWT